MQEIILNNELTFSFEPLGKRVRLIILGYGRELVCRKETFQNVLKFLTINEASLFKGRLQLNKNKDDIEIMIKGHPIATISSKIFEQAIAEIRE